MGVPPVLARAGVVTCASLCLRTACPRGDTGLETLVGGRQQ
jgi:hypothetical protein